MSLLLKSTSALLLPLLMSIPLRAETPSVACAPSAPVAAIDSTIRLTAWSAAAGTKPTYHWTADQGALDSAAGREVRWSLKDVETGPQSAEVELRQGDAVLAHCTVEVRVVRSLDESALRGNAERTTSRAFLDPSQKEADGFGLYSYVLFGAQPSEADKERYKGILDACIKLMPATAELQKYLPPDRLNAVFVPVQEAPKDKVDAAWLLDHYDYARARAMLAQAPVSNRTGIYIVSTSTPLLSGKPASRKYLIQDLSSVPALLAATWVDAFINQAAQEKYWEPSTPTQFVLKLRLAISVIAIGVPQVQQALTKWISTKG